MTDIFFSYRSDDRERVRPVRDAFAGLGFDVFWDQQVPAGVDWDSWIRRHLAQSKCAVVFWSATSVTSDNVRHEAVVAKQQNKLISVLLEPLTAEQFPMGLYLQQAANLVDWNGNLQNAEWQKLRAEVEAKLTPAWVRDRLDELEAELVAERARREAAERRDKVWQAQIGKEAQAQQELKRERDNAADESAALALTVQELSRALSESKEEAAELSRRLQDAESQLQAFDRQRVGTAPRLETDQKLSAPEEQLVGLADGDREDPTSTSDRAAKKLGAQTIPETKARRMRAGDVLFFAGVPVIAALIMLGSWIY